MGMRNLKSKTLTATTPEEIDALVNAFGETHKIEFTVPVPTHDGTYQRLLLYQAEEQAATEPVITDEWVDCLVCGKPWKIQVYSSCRCGNSDRTKIKRRV